MASRLASPAARATGAARIALAKLRAATILHRLDRIPLPKVMTRGMVHDFCLIAGLWPSLSHCHYGFVAIPSEAGLDSCRHPLESRHAGQNLFPVEVRRD